MIVDGQEQLEAGAAVLGQRAVLEIHVPLEAVEHRPETAVQIAAAAEVYAHQEGIVNVYSDETPGQEFVDQARASLSPDVVASATEVGSKLTIGEALDLARLHQRNAT